MRGKLKTLSKLRQKIVSLREERKKLEDSLFRPKKMIRASLSFIPGYCGKKDCRCKRGQPHGSYPYLSERDADPFVWEQVRLFSQINSAPVINLTIPSPVVSLFNFDPTLLPPRRTMILSATLNTCLRL